MSRLSWASVLLVSALTVIGCAAPYPGTAPYAPGYGGTYYESAPQDIYATPWVGSNTPWVYYNGDWFQNGMLYYFFGPQYGWAPYYAYPTIYIVRPAEWYGPRWVVWYEKNPHYYKNFSRTYPYWHGHTYTKHYDRTFYERHHRGQGAGWQEGWRGVKPERRPAPERAAPPVERRPAPTRVAPMREAPPAREVRPAPRVAPETRPVPKAVRPAPPPPARELRKPPEVRPPAREIRKAPEVRPPAREMRKAPEPRAPAKEVQPPSRPKPKPAPKPKEEREESSPRRF